MQNFFLVIELISFKHAKNIDIVVIFVYEEYIKVLEYDTNRKNDMKYKKKCKQYV